MLDRQYQSPSSRLRSQDITASRTRTPARVMDPGPRDPADPAKAALTRTMATFFPPPPRFLGHPVVPYD